ncbi:MAG: DUF2141 domain-containing protein [Sphingomonas sp.]
MRKVLQWSLAIVATSLPAIAAAGTLEIVVSTPSATDGEIGCALFKNEAGFPMAPEKAQRIWVKANPQTVCRYENVAPGTYAVAVSLDLNGNRRTDKNFIGIPTEAWGVSNNVRPRMRSPRFAEARFTVPAEGRRIEIDVKR